MDDLSVYGETFQEALDNLEKVLKRFQEANLALSHEKCRMMFTKGVVLGYVLKIGPIRIGIDRFDRFNGSPV